MKMSMTDISDAVFELRNNASADFENLNYDGVDSLEAEVTFAIAIILDDYHKLCARKQYLKSLPITDDLDAE